MLSSCKDGVQKNLEVHFKNGEVDTLQLLTYAYFIDERGVLYVTPNQVRSSSPIAYEVKYVKEVK
ncbi:hypothetical protein [Sphingobacterium daejeonense]|uniref:hypothetical protein n=1 Tax=Sphingobacterium daejeonense TaxID=371142 RepID=UPI0010FDE82A|nr:hypothetical protein [Sphingobacterium daejeonense]